MISFDEEEIKDKYLRPCHCRDDQGDVERSFCYVEGTKRDKAMSDNRNELNENVWYEIKPPRLFSKEFTPVITARQIYVTRVMLEGKRGVMEDEDETKHKEKTNISMNKKKSAVRFLSQMNLE